MSLIRLVHLPLVSILQVVPFLPPIDRRDSEYDQHMVIGVCHPPLSDQ
jgi:hypothetical protein